MEPVKKAWYKKWWGITIIAVIALVVIGSLADSGEEKTPISTPVTKESRPTAPPTSEPTKEPSPEPAPAPKQWVEVKSWQGSGIKKTEPFDIASDKWRITHSNTGGGILQIMVEKPGSNMPADIAANTQNAGTDTSYIYQQGTFYLSINSANTNWTIKVEEER